MEGFVLHILKLNILAAVVVLSVRLLCVFLKNKLTARWKYLVWLVLSVTLLFPVRLPEELSLFRMPVRLPAKELSLSPSPISETAPGQELTQGTDSKLNTPSGHTAPTVTQAEFVDHAARTAASPDRRSKTAASGTAFIDSALESLPPASSLFLILWLSVALVVILFEGFSYFFSMKKLRRMSIPAHNRQTREIYTSVCRTKHIACPPALNQNAGLSTPLLAGLRKTQLYLPSVGYSPEELRLIFHHELSHYLHRDLWYKMLLRVCATIYWFNPFLWIMLKEAEKDLENLCDANVVRFCTPSGHKLYRRLLLRTVALENHVPYVTAGLNDTTMVFKERIFYMLRLKELKNNLLPGVLLCVLLLAVNISVVFSASIPEASYRETPSLINQNSTSADASQNIGFTDSDHSAASDNAKTVSSDFSDSKTPQTVSPTSYTDGGSSQTDQEKNAEYELYTDDTVNVRSLPSMNGSILHTLPFGNAVTVTGASQDGWLPVTVDGISGYIREDYLTGDKPLTGNTGTPADPAAEHPAENAVTGNAAQQNLTPQTDAAASGAVQDSSTPGGAISGTDTASESTQQNTFNVLSVGPSERQWLFSFEYDNTVVIKGSDGTGNWYDGDGVSYGNLDALGPNDPIYNERGEVYYRNLTLAKQAANLSSPSEVNDPHDLYTWDSQIETYIPYQQGGSEGLPIGRGNGWYYYDTASGSYLPW